MPAVEKVAAKPAVKVVPKTDAKTADTPEKPKTPRTNFSKMWPEDQPIKVLVAENPKKEGSAARERFQHYFNSKTVGDYLAAGGTYQDIAYDIGRLFIQIG